MAAPFEIPFDTQLAFLWNELTGSENRTLRGLRANNQLLPRDYAKLFEELYERSGGKGMEARMNNAATVFAGMQNEVPDLPQNAIRAYRFLTDKGLSGQQAAGVVGNLMAESYNEIRPDAFNPEGGGQGAYGIAQWRGSRLDALNKFAEANKPRDAEPPLEAKMNGKKPMSLLRMFQDPQTMRTMAGNFFTKRDPASGLTKAQSLAAGMDALILRGYGQGDAIRQGGLRRAEVDRQNLTADWFAKQPNGEMYAEMLRMGVPIGQVYTAYQKAQTGDYVVVGDALVDRKTGKVIYQGQGAGGGSRRISLPDGTVIDLGPSFDGDLNESQAMLYGQRMKDANVILNTFEGQGTDIFQNVLNNVPWGLGRMAQTSEFKSFDDARRDFVNAVLRRESGAAIAPSEFESAARQYFPVVGDGPQQIEEKRRRRETATQLLIASAGPSGQQYLALLEAEQKKLNPLFGTPEYEKERKRLEEQQANTSANGNTVIE